MKLNIKRCDSYGREDPCGDFWSYGEVCDICRDQYLVDAAIHNKYPNVGEKDICISCMRKILDNDLDRNSQTLFRTEKVIIPRRNLVICGDSMKVTDTENIEVTFYPELDGRFIKTGMVYIGKRNTGWFLGKCQYVKDHIIYGYPNFDIYPYDDYECRVVTNITGVN